MEDGNKQDAKKIPVINHEVRKLVHYHGSNSNILMLLIM